VIRRLFEQAWGVASRAHSGCEAATRPGVMLFEGIAAECARLSAPAVSGLVTLSFDPDVGTLWLSPAGRSTVSAVSGPWRRLQILVPQTVIESVTRDLGFPSGWSVEFEPGPVASAELIDRAEALAAQLHAGLPMSSLELDESIFEIAFLLICHEAGIGMPGIGRIPPAAAAPAGDWVRALAAAILAQARDSPDPAADLLPELLAKLARANTPGGPGAAN
jgi:hypothetical protein